MIQIQHDKLGHFFWSSVLLIPLVIVLGQFYGGLALILSAIAKEIIYDKMMGKGNCEFMDFVYGSAPVVVMYLTTNNI